MERKQFTFYISFYNGIQDIEDPEDRLKMYDAICEYALFEKEPELPKHLKPAFQFIKPNLDAGRKKAERGSLGGKSKQGDISCLDDDGSKGTSLASSDSSSKDKSKKEIEKEKEKESKSKSESNSFSGRPTTEEIFEFFEKMKLNGDPKRFIDYNDANGWQLKNWQAAAIGWSLKEKQHGAGSAGQVEGGTRLPEGLDPDSLPRGGIFDVI